MGEIVQEPICIVGMGRSGTSMVTRLLNLCDLDLGTPEDCLAPQEDNPLGFFENKRFQDINEELLAHFHGSWDNPPSLPDHWEHDLALESIVRKAQALIYEFSANHIWGWKDPRTTVLIPFWKFLIPSLRFVICIRSPLEIARSLVKRDKFPVQKSVLLWNLYTRAAIRYTQGNPRIFTFYDDFFIKPLDEISRLAKFCGLQKSPSSAILLDVIRPELRHHKDEVSALLTDTDIPSEFKILYLGIRALSNPEMMQRTQSRTREDVVSNNVDKFFQIMEEFRTQKPLAQLQAKVAHLHTLLATGAQNTPPSNAELQQSGFLQNKNVTSKELSWTGERLVTTEYGQGALEHLHRYALARELAHHKVVLDIASGEGYGSNILAQVAQQVVGVDIAPDAIKHAQAKYGRDNLSFIVGTCANIPLESACVDLVVSFETLEHHDQHTEMIAEVKRVLRPDGVVTISSPNKYEYSDVPGYKNPFHVKELYLHEFEDLLNSKFKNVMILGQRFTTSSYVAPLSVHLQNFKTLTGDFTTIVREEGMPHPTFFIAIASDESLPQVTSGLFEGYKNLLLEKDRTIREMEQVTYQKDKLIMDLNLRLQAMQQTIGWKMLERLSRIRDRLAPPGSRRRALYKIIHRTGEVLLDEGPWGVVKRAGWKLTRMLKGQH